MRILRAALVLLLGVATGKAQPVDVMPIVQQFLMVESEMDLYKATPLGQRSSQPVFTALRNVARNWRRCIDYGYEGTCKNLIYSHWMISHQSHDGPTTTEQVMAAAKEWACARLADTILVSSFRVNSQRWLYAQESPLQNDDDHRALTKDIDDAIKRFHEAAQIEIAAAFGHNDQVVRPKYMELFQECITERLPATYLS